jgi:hypothetical protein
MSESAAVTETCFPVSVIVERRPANDAAPWARPQWGVVGVVAGEQLSAGEEGPVLVHSHDGCDQFLHKGYAVRLYRDSAESYWYNLVGRSPSLFVVCRENDDGDLEPFLVTANYDEAGAYMEADGIVHSTPVPPEIYQWLERYVVENFQPAERKKRKREKWFEESERG